MSENNLYPYQLSVVKEERRRLNGHSSAIIWFTGLSASGKSTIARFLDRKLYKRGIHTYLLDGDNIRCGLNRDLGFDQLNREENIRRIGEVSKLFIDAGIIVITAFISPYREDRDKVRKLVENGEFIEIYVKCSLDICESRDPKGLYKKARKGELKNFTGITDPYEEPKKPEIIIDSGSETPENASDLIFSYLEKNHFLSFMEKQEP